MKTRRVAALTFALGIALGTGARAQDNNTGTGNQGGSDTQTIRGVVAGVTAEGEMVLDYRTNRAVLAEAAYVSVVGSPATGQENASERRGGDQAREDRSGKQRDNIYIVWLTPRTKIYEAGDASGREGRKKETSLDRLEVGDRVEIQFTPREEPADRPGANQTTQMRRTHGRNRTYVGDANAITILPSRRDSAPSDRNR
jgi:hypothetical protein